MPQNENPDFFSKQVSNARRFFLELRPEGTEELSALSGGCEHALPDYEIHRRDFHCYGIEYVAGGAGTLTLNENIYPLSPGVFFSYGPRTPHHIRTDRNRLLVKYFIDFEGRQAEPLMREASLPPGSVVQVSAPNEISTIFEELIKNGRNGTPFTGRICTLLLQQLLLKTAETVIPFGSANSHAFATYQRCRRFMEENAVRYRSMESLTADCGINSAYLCRLFSRFDNQTPHQLLIRLKLAKAAERLLEPETWIKEVAAGFGFSDAFHFSRAFKNVYGVPPKEFIRLRRGRR